MTPEIQALLNAAKDAVTVGAQTPALLRLKAAIRAVETGADRVQHVARASTYKLGPVIEMQVSTPGYFHRVNGVEYPIEGKHIQVYIAEKDGKGWGRFVHEMEDGRFVAIPALGQAA